LPRAGICAPQPERGPHRRGEGAAVMSPGRTRRRAAAAAALSTAVGLTAGIAAGGPREARERWRELQAAHGAPWRERAALCRAVRAEAGETDPICARAAEAEAKALREGGHVEGAAAADALACGRGAPRDP